MLNFPHSPNSHKKLFSLYFQIANKLKPLLTVTNSLSHRHRFLLSPSPNPASPSQTPSQTQPHRRQTQPHRCKHHRKPNLTIANTVANTASPSPILVSPSPFLGLPSPIHLTSPSPIHFARDDSTRRLFAMVQLANRSQRFSSLAVRNASILHQLFVMIQCFAPSAMLPVTLQSFAISGFFFFFFF